MRSPVKARLLLSASLFALFCRATLAQISAEQYLQPPSPQLLTNPYISLCPAVGAIPCLIPIEPEKVFCLLSREARALVDMGSGSWLACDCLGWAKLEEQRIGQWIVFLPVEGAEFGETMRLLLLR